MFGPIWSYEIWLKMIAFRIYFQRSVEWKSADYLSMIIFFVSEVKMNIEEKNLQVTKGDNWVAKHNPSMYIFEYCARFYAQIFYANNLGRKIQRFFFFKRLKSCIFSDRVEVIFSAMLIFMHEQNKCTVSKPFY